LTRKTGQVRPRYAPITVRVMEQSEDPANELEQDGAKPIGQGGGVSPSGSPLPQPAKKQSQAPKGPAPALKPAKPSPLLQGITPKPAPKVHLSETQSVEMDDGCDWRTINGAHICIGSDGIITKGPDHFVGQNARNVTAKLSYVGLTKEKEKLASEWEEKIRKTIGGQHTADNAPADIVKGEHAVEVKTNQASKKDRIEMRPDSRERKEALAKEQNMKGHTIGVDLRGGKPVIYYRSGFGAYRYGSMERVTLAQLKDKFR
jgi:hypothetical protein